MKLAVSINWKVGQNSANFTLWKGFWGSTPDTALLGQLPESDFKNDAFFLLAQSRYLRIETCMLGQSAQGENREKGGAKGGKRRGRKELPIVF